MFPWKKIRKRKFLEVLDGEGRIVSPDLDAFDPVSLPPDESSEPVE